MSGWMQTYTGRAFHPLEPNLDDIDIEDIAHALAMTCRYNGHCYRFYSVAEHCVILSHTVDPVNARWALMHDAAEAYIGDMVRPLKYDLPEFQAAEDRLDAAIAGKFDLGWPMPAQVKEHDTRIVIDERSQNMATAPQPWSLLAGYQPLGVTLSYWDPTRAEVEFMSRYKQLFNK